MARIGNAPSGEKTALTGVEKFPIAGSQYGLVSSILEYIRTATATFTNKTLSSPTITSPTISGTPILSEALRLGGDISPSQITSNQDDYNPTGLATASTLRLSSDASRNLTGLQGGTDGRIIIIHNVGAQNIVVKDDDGATSTAANRFALAGDITLAGDNSLILRYDTTSSRWRCIARYT